MTARPHIADVAGGRLRNRGVFAPGARAMPPEGAVHSARLHRPAFGGGGVGYPAAADFPPLCPVLRKEADPVADALPVQGPHSAACNRPHTGRGCGLNARPGRHDRM